ncbi:MAG: two-component sensor histidine kinase [Actinomycetia bacterium]|nr:two-component sensor histidine kinase [Actinomycetes bacterium]
MDGPESAGGTPLRRQVLTSIATVAVLAIVLFTIPLILAVQRLYRDEAVTRLERDATRIAAAAPADEETNPRPVPPPIGLSAHLTAGIFSTNGIRLAGSGPAVSKVAAAARDARLHDKVEGGMLSVSAPIPGDDGVTGVVLVSMDYDLVSDRIEWALLFMVGLAFTAIALAVVFARYQSARLARPLERFTTAAQALGEGDFSVRASRSGVREVDEAGEALEATARRLGELLDRERAFSADVSHQLRTPLTGLLLGLEAALDRSGADLRAAVTTALERGDHLQETIEDLLRLARDTGQVRDELDVTGILDEARSRWAGPLAAKGRQLTIQAYDPLPMVRVAPGSVRQILDVLIDNAATHGEGPITVRAGDIGSGLAIDVGDQGQGIPEGADVFIRRPEPETGHGIGLALARSLAEAEGGRLVLRHESPPVFALLLPGTDE